MAKYKKAVIHRLPEIIERDGGQWVCHYCGKKLIPFGTPRGTEPYYVYSELWGGMIPNKDYNHAVADHIVAHSQGGSNELDNLVAACQKCNERKGVRGYEEFIAIIRSAS